MYPASLISNLRNAPYPYAQVYASSHIRDSKIKTSVPGVTTVNGEQTPDADFFDEESILKNPRKRSVKQVQRFAFTPFELPEVLYCSISDADVKRLGRYGIRVGTSFYRTKRALRKHVENVENIVKIYSQGKEDFFWKERTGFSNLVPVKKDYRVLPKNTDKEHDIDTKSFDIVESVAGTQERKDLTQDTFLDRRADIESKMTSGQGQSRYVTKYNKSDLISELPSLGKETYLANFETNPDDVNKGIRRKRRMRRRKNA